MDGETTYPKIVNDVKFIKNKTLSGKTFFVLASEQYGKYLKIPIEKKKYFETAISLFDGKHSIPSVKDEIDATFNTNVDINSLFHVLNNAGMFEEGCNQNTELYIMTNEVINIDLDNKMGALQDNVQRVAKPLEIIFGCLMLLSISAILINFQEIADIMHSYEYVHSSSIAGKNIIIFVLLSFLSIMLHELGHIVVGIGCGKRLERISVNLYCGILPMCFVKFRGLVTLDARKKLCVVSAGILVNLLISLSCLMMLPFFTEYNNVVLILQLMFYENLFSIFSNLIPLSLSDGYFIFSILTDTYNAKIYMIRYLFNPRIKGEKSKRSIILSFCFLIFTVVGMVFVSISLLKRIMSLFANASPVFKATVLMLLILYLVFSSVFQIKRIICSRRKTNDDKYFGKDLTSV